MQNDLSVITLFDEDGNEVEFNVVTKLDIEESEYVIVVPSEDEDGDEAIVLKIEIDENGDEMFATVEDDEELEIVSEAYYTLFEDGQLD